MSHSKTPTECTVHGVLSVLCNAVVVREATHACVSVVGVHRSVTTYRIIDPQPNFSRKLLCVHLSESVDESPPASSTTQLKCHSTASYSPAHEYTSSQILHIYGISVVICGGLPIRQAASNHHKPPLKHRKYAGFGMIGIRKSIVLHQHGLATLNEP